MSKESAKEFALAALEDDELRERTAKIEPEKVVAIAKELGYDFTAEELTGVMNEDMELSADDLEAAAGGNSRTQYNEAYRQRYLKKNLGNTDANQKAMQFYCHGDTNGPKHEWNLTYKDQKESGEWCKENYWCAQNNKNRDDYQLI